jgi:AraC-like DNA-binding protein
MQAEKDSPVLAAKAGIYREAATTGPLARYFRCVWSHRLPADFGGRILIVPDGCSDLIWTGERLMVVGPDRTSAFPELKPGGHIQGLRFRPGAALAWLDTPLSELVGRTMPLTDFWGYKAEAIQARLLELPVPERFSHLVQMLEMHDTGDPPEDIQALFVRLSGADGRRASVRSLAVDIAVGERTLRRRSREHLGYGPKTLERILRFQTFLQCARDLRCDSLANLALQAGYADQSHMNREVKALSTLTPSEIRTQLSA